MARSIVLCLILYVAVADSGILTKDLHRIQDLESRDGCEILDRFDSDVQCKGNVHDVFSVAGQVMTMADTGTVCRAGFTLDFFACKGGLWVQVPLSFARSLKRREDQHHREKRFWGTVEAVIGVIGGVVDIFCTFLCDNGGGGGGGGGSPNTFPQIDCPYVGPQYAKTGDTMVVTWTEPTGTDTEDGSLSPKRSGLAPGSVFTASTHFIKYRVVDSGGLSADCEILFSVHTIHCSPLMYPRNGRLHCTNRDISGSVCTFDCDDGHNVDGASSITCEEGTWSGVEPRCKAVSCGTPPSVTNGQLTCLGDVVYGTYCLMSCNRGFEPRGMMMSTCLATGHWTPPGTCADVTPPSFTNGCPDDVDDYAEKKGGGKVVTWDDPAASDNSGPGVTITGSHQSGASFELGETKVRLTATDAEGNTDQCSFRVTINGLYCPEPDLQDPIDKLRYDCPDGYGYGFSCSLSCHSGFPLQGPDSILCQKDPNVFPATASWTWAVDAFKPFCKNTSCPDLAVPKNGALACDGWGSGGSMCSMLCNEDYDIARDVPDIYTCGQQSGKWFPSDNIYDCDRKLSPGSMKLRSDFFYYSGSCHDNNTQLEIAQKFIHILNTSNTFTDVCGAAVPECRVEFVNIKCGETGRRKRFVKRSASEIFLTKVKRSTVPTVIIFEVVVPFNIGSKEDAEAARTRVEGELDNVNSAIDQMLDGGGLSMAEYGLNTQADSFYPGYAAFSCPFGTAENYKHVSCSGCSTGTYVEAGSGNCVSCPVGTYTDEGFSDACKPCGEGKSTRSTESRSVNDCIDTCTEGSFSMDGMAPCTPCSPGTYQDAVAMTSCTSCPTGTTSPQGSHNASSCVAFDLKVHANTETVFGNISSDLSALTMYFWCRLDTSLGHTLARITDTDRNTVMELSISSNVFLNIQGNSVDTDVTPATNRWQHLTLTLDGSSKNIALYLNGNAVYSDNMASLTIPLAPSDSSVAIVSGNGDVTQSGLNIIERVASPDDIQAQSSTCVSTLQESVLTFIKNGTNLIVPSQCDAVDGCLGNPCGSHPCKDDLEGFKCDCQDSWTGVTCNVPPDYCAHHECQNNAICENGNGNYTCQCLKGFKGELCQELVVNGNWGDWSKKTECSTSCGGGTRSRSRQCDSPPPDVDGDTCDGASEETEQCNTDACPECPVLRLSSGNLKNCTESNGYTRCTITCRGDMVFYEKPLPVYECGAGSDYVWNHQEHKSNARPPACRTAMGAARYDVTHTVTYQDLPCSSGNSRSDEIKSQVSGNIDVLPCVQESICTTSVSINNCNNNGVSKRSTTSTVVSILISTIMGDSASLDLTEFVENNIVTTGLTNYLNKLMKTELSVQSLVNSSNTLLPLTIDGATYQVDTNSMSTTSLAICPSGTTPTEGVCGQCPPGTQEVSGKCVLCEKGTYQHEAASASCRMCPSSTTTPGVGADDVSQCTDEEAESERDHEPQWKLIAIGLSCLGGACFIAVAVIIVVKKKGYYKIQISSSRPSTAGSFHKMFHHRVSVASLPPPYSQEEPQMPPSSTSAFRTQMLVMEAPEMRAPKDPLPPLKCTFQYTPGTKII